MSLSQKEFDHIVKLVPFVACELVIMNTEKEFLLMWRDDKHYKGWHFPGGLLRYKESFRDRIRYVAQEELGVRIKKAEFIDVYNYLDDPRGHTVALIFLCTTDQKPKGGKFFKKIPRNTLKHYREYVETVLRK